MLEKERIKEGSVRGRGDILAKKETNEEGWWWWGLGYEKMMRNDEYMRNWDCEGGRKNKLQH